VSVQGGRRALFVPFFFAAFQRHVTHQAVTSVTRSGREADREDTMAAKEMHIATLQAPRSSSYFGCDVYGEERRSRLTTFSGCDIVIASDSVAMIGSPSSVGLATMWLERRKLISLPVSRDWAANDRVREGTATPPLPSRPFPAPAPAEIVPWFPPPPPQSSSSSSSRYHEPQTNDDSGAATPTLLADEELEAADFILDEAPSKRQRRAGASSPAMDGVQTPPPRPPIKRSPALMTPPSRELLRGGSETPPRRALLESLPAAWDRPDSDEPPLQRRGTFGTFDLSQPSPTSFSPIALPLPVVALPPAPLLMKPVARAFWRR
jgi:hypothetical protein